VKFQYTHTRLLVSNFKHCFNFYKTVLDLPVAFGDANDVYAEFKTDTAIIALFKKDLMAKAIGSEESKANGTGHDYAVLIFGVENVDASYEALKKKGVEFVSPPKDQPDWSIRVAHFRDPDGNLIEINAPLKSK
jgi:predicted enzyme related to lactoylglutathione lyase